MTMTKPTRILVVEDEAVIAFALRELLTAFGFVVIGPAPSSRKALKLVAEEAIDAALLDVHLGKDRIDGVAEALAAASIPFIFTTGYAGPSALPTAFRDRPTINKPYQPEQLCDALVQLLAEKVDAATLSSGTVNT